MKKTLFLSLSIWSLCFVSNSLSAQSIAELRIDLDIQQQPLTAIFSDIEQRYPVRFYYQSKDLPSANFNFQASNERLEDVLNRLLISTPLSFFTYRDYAIFVAPRGVISEVYSANYYEALEQSLTAEDTEEEADLPLTVGDISELRPSGQATVSGEIVQKDNGEPIIGATILFTELGDGTATDENGQFELEVPTGDHEILVQFVGNADLRREIVVYSDGNLRLEMETSAVQLQEVVVGADAPDVNVQNVQVGVTRLDIQNIKKLPSFLGEADVIRSLLLSPGVSTIGEGATGFNVRGGEVDQNLILQDDGFIFNASHALGFFSTFNSDLINNVTLYKGNIPAQFGGRLASVLDVEMRDGDFERFKIKGGVGPVSSRLAVEGPVISEKSSFIAGFRASYSDWVLRATNNIELQRSSAFFYDANLRYTHKINDKNTVILAGYISEDEFTFNEEFGFDYTTTMGQAISKNIFSDRLFSRLSLTFSQYESAQFDFDGLDASRLDNNISYFKLKELLTFTPTDDLEFNAGISGIYYVTEPGSRQPEGETSQIFAEALEEERGLESAAFVNGEWTVSAAFTVSAGLRFALYQFLGPKTVFEYENPDFPAEEEIIGATSYESGDVIASYNSLEPRVSMRYRFSPTISVKAGYSRTAQFINQIFNSDSPTPTSQLQLSTPYIAPTRSHNVSIGYFQNFDNNNWETSVEFYGRQIDELFDFKDFAELVVNEHLETELLRGEGRAYGMEVSLKKNQGLLNGFVSYTLSRTERQVTGINDGDWYPSNFDKPHDLSLVLNYQYNQRHTLTVNFNYSTGRPTTPPLGGYRAQNGLIVPIYAERNQLRIPDYHRLDIAYTIGKGYRKDKKFKTSWTFSIYNVYGRRNPFSVFFTQTPFTAAQANRLSVLGSIFPAITFNFETI